jgi:hypothetical protein
MELTRKKDIKRDESLVAYDICHCSNFAVEALKASEDGVVKVDLDCEYILYAQWDDEDYEELGIKGYWVIDTGDCH